MEGSEVKDCAHPVYKNTTANNTAPVAPIFHILAHEPGEER